MGRKRPKWGNIARGQHNPLSYAVSSRDQSVIQMVEQAVQSKQVTLAYQAIVPSIHQSQPAFYEGLIRVLDETGRIIPAREFINEVENTEIGRMLDCLALEKGLRALLQHPSLRLAINMSARSIGYPRWIKSLRRGLSQNDTIAERLILEVNEASALQVPELVVGFMADLHAEGISFALDDFGAEMTSFKHLTGFNFDILKIDGQFVRGVATDADKQCLTRSFVAIASEFDFVTVAECVEKPEDAAYLHQIGVDCLQGYYFGAPTVNPPWLEPATQKASA